MTPPHHVMRVVASGLLRYENLQAAVEIPKRPYAFTMAGACLLMLLCLSVNGQTLSQQSSVHPQVDALDKDPIAILEIGAASNWNFNGGATPFAPNLAAEVTTGWNLRRACRPSIRADRQNGTRICFSKNRGRYRGRRNLCLVLAPNGYI